MATTASSPTISIDVAKDLDSLSALNTMLTGQAHAVFTVLGRQFMNMKAEDPFACADRMIDLADPAPNWIKLAEGFGVQAARAATADEFIREFGAAMREPGPRLIEAVLEV